MFSKRKKLLVPHQGKVFVESVKQVSREKNLIVWDITLNPDHVYAERAWKDGPLYGDKETHEVSIVFTADSNSFDAENYTVLKLKIRNGIKWEYVVERNPFSIRVIAYRAKNDPRKNRESVINKRRR